MIEDYEIVTLPARGTLAFNGAPIAAVPFRTGVGGASQSVNYTPASFGDDTFTYRALTSGGMAGSAAVAVNILNNAPTAQPVSLQVQRGVPAALTLLAADVDTLDVLTYTVSAPAMGTLSGTAPNLTYTASPGSFGTDTLTYSVSDGTTSSSTEQIVVTIGNTAPVISGVPATIATVGVAYSFIPTASDVNLDPLSFSIINRPLWAVFDTATGTLTGTPQASDIGTNAGIVITVTDGTLASALPFSISVTGNLPPVFTSTGFTPNPGVAGEGMVFTALATDPESQPLTYLWNFGDGTTGAGTPVGKTFAAPGAYTVIVTATDAQGVSATASLAVTVRRPGALPLPLSITSNRLRAFNPSRGTDTLDLRGSLVFATGVTSLAGAVRVEVGQVKQDFVTNSAGSAARPPQRFRFTASQRRGVLTSNSAAFTLHLRANFLAELARVGRAPNTSGAADLPVLITFQNQDYTGTASLLVSGNERTSTGN